MTHFVQRIQRDKLIPGQRTVRIWLNTLSFFGIKNPSNKYDIFLSNTEKTRAKAFSKSIKSKIKIGINAF